MLNKLSGIAKFLPQGIKHKNKYIKGMRKAVRDVFSAPLVVLAKLKSVIDIAHIIPASRAIHSTVVDGNIIPFSKPMIISKPIIPSMIYKILFIVKEWLRINFAKIVPHIGQR